MNGHPASDSASTQDDKREVAVHLDVELIASIDARRGGAARSHYIEQVLAVAMDRIVPHQPEHTAPTRAIEPGEQPLRPSAGSDVEPRAHRSGLRRAL